MKPRDTLPASTRREALRDGLPATIKLLEHRRAAEIADGYIEDYVALSWLEWHGGALRITTTGENICRQLVLWSEQNQPLPTP